jgi:hypothetical protein
MVPPGANALLMSENSATQPPLVIHRAPWQNDNLQWSPQQVTWTKPITAPSAWFQTEITSGVGSNSTWQRWRAR